MIYEKVIEQKFALVDTAYHMIILSCLALRIIHDCQVLTSFVSCRTGGAIPMQVFFFAFSILGQLEATLDSLGSVNQTKIGKDFSYSNIHAVFVWTPGSDWSTVCLDLQGVMSHMWMSLRAGQSASRTVPFTEGQAISRFIFEIFHSRMIARCRWRTIPFDLLADRFVLWFQVCGIEIWSCFSPLVCPEYCFDRILYMLL